MRNIIYFLYCFLAVYLIKLSIDDYLDGLLSGSSEPSRKAIMKLTRLIENFGAIMVKSTERMEDYIDTLDARISSIEQAIGIARPAAVQPSFPMPTAAPVAAPVAAPQTSGAPNLSENVGAPNLSATPSGNVGAPSLEGGGDIPAPATGSSPVTGAGISSADLLKAASKLQKAPVQEPGAPDDPGIAPAPAFSPFGVSAQDIQDIRSGLTKVDPDEHRKQREAAQAGGSMPAGIALNLEVKDALAKRASRLKEDDDEEEDFEPTAVAPAAPQKSTKQMKEALQFELRDAFSSLLESDTQEEDED
jgi:hypothetical protein